MISVLIAFHFGLVALWVIGSTRTGIQAQIAFATGENDEFVSFLRMADGRGPRLFRNAGVLVLVSGSLLANADAYNVPAHNLAFAFVCLIVAILTGAAAVGPMNTKLLENANRNGGPPYAYAADFYAVVLGHYVKLGCLTAAAVAVFVGQFG